jgi:hypothetical protein
MELASAGHVLARLTGPPHLRQPAQPWQAAQARQMARLRDDLAIRQVIVLSHPERRSHVVLANPSPGAERFDSES